MDVQPTGSNHRTIVYFIFLSKEKILLLNGQTFVGDCSHSFGYQMGFPKDGQGAAYQLEGFFLLGKKNKLGSQFLCLFFEQFGKRETVSPL